MALRFQFIKHPKLAVYETPAQAYLIIEGAPQTYRVTKETRKRNVGSLSCRHRALDKQGKCYRVNESKYDEQQQKS
jgi:hypothetical protein